VGVLLRGGLEGTLPLQCSLDLDRRYGRMLLYDAMRDYHHRSAVEKVEHPILDSIRLGPQFVDAVTKVVRSWPAEHVTLIREELQTCPTLYLSLDGHSDGKDRHKGPAREGNALLQGLVLCGRCGLRMMVRYSVRKGHQISNYVCARRGIESAGPMCQCIAGLAVDGAVG
jgi:hypothetical protein